MTRFRGAVQRLDDCKGLDFLPLLSSSLMLFFHFEVCSAIGLDGLVVIGGDEPLLQLVLGPAWRQRSD